MRIEEMSSDERGAAAVFVAILLVVIFGMVVLVVDVGGLLLLRGRVVTAADSASLAAAQSCASDQVTEAQAEADEVALGNLSGVTNVSGVPIDSPACGQGSGTVSVTYSGLQELYFAPILGFDSERSVSGSATAMWGPSTGAEPIPIVLSNPCQSRCAYWYDPENVSEADRTFGFTHLRRWCESTGGSRDECGGSLSDWIRGDSPPVRLIDSPHLVPAVSGRDDWEEAVLEQIDEKPRIFVVHDPDTSTPENYAAIGFRPLLVDSLSSQIVDAEELCAELTFDRLERGPVLEVVTEILSCLLRFGLGQIHIEVFPENLDYEYDPILHTFEWLEEATDNVRIEIRWSGRVNQTECPSPIPEGEPWCLVVSWDGPQAGGTEPNASSVDLGLRAIRLTQDE